MSNINDYFCNLSTWTADKFSEPVAILCLPIASLLWIVTLGMVNELTLFLSVLAITLTQMVLQSQKQETQVNKLQMSELIKAIPGTREELAKTDGMRPQDIRRLKDEETN